MSKNYLVSHKAALTLSSLEAQLSTKTPLFRAASHAGVRQLGLDDPLHLGWEPSPFKPHETFEFRLINLTWATAEGVASLAALVDCLRNASNRAVSFHIDQTSELWADALQLNQLVTDSWNEPSAAIQPIQGCYVLPLFRGELTSDQSCADLGQDLTSRAGDILKQLKRAANLEIRDALDLFFREAMLNVFQHAYGRANAHRLFGSITVTPVPSASHLADLPYTTEEELNWFRTWSGRGLMLEAAVADCGVGIPVTLWQDYERHFPDHIREYKQALRSGPNRTAVARALLHRRIVLWALDHRSTRKRPEDFPNRLSALTWRGLHRAMNSIARMQGCVILRSGQSRTGYAFHPSVTGLITLPGVQRWEFPGTAIVVRIPLAVSKPRHSVTSPSTATRAALRPNAIIRASDISRPPALPISRISPVVGISHSFRTIAQDDVGWLLDRITAVPPHLLQVHLCLAFTSDIVLSQLQAYSQDECGPPRLVVFWSHNQPPRWKCVGIMPEESRAIILALENYGVTKLGDNPIVERLARELVSDYSPHLSLEDGALRITSFHFDIQPEDIDVALQLAFEEWCTESERTWIFEEAGKVVRLRSGRLVQRYASVFEMLRASDFLAQILGWRLATLLKAFAATMPPPIIADSEAANFIIRNLLLDQKEHYDIVVAEATISETNRPMMAFVDAVHRGDALRSLLAQQPNCKTVISCLDLRLDANTTLYSDPSVSVHCLLRFPFDSGEVQEPVPPDLQILELDRVTHVPGPSADINLYQLGTDSARCQFLEIHPEIFRYGIQQSGGRTHVVTLSTSELVRHHKVDLLLWISSAIRALIASHPGIGDVGTLVIFARGDANVQGLILSLGESIANAFGWDALSVRIPAAAAGEREVFARATPDLLKNIADVSAGHLRFAFSRPTRYLALFLDDACVTGRGLLNFLVRVARAGAEQLPTAVLSIPLVSRFSPGEEIFYSDAIRELYSSGPTASCVPLFFRPLFRLQIRSFESIDSAPVTRLLETLVRSKQFLDARLEDYLFGLRAAFDIVMRLRRDGASTEARSFPFYSGRAVSKSEVSTRVVWVRQLIALQEQNVAVSSELLLRIRETCDALDFGLLTMLAIEPTLLSTPPLRRECRKGIVDLAVAALQSHVLLEVRSNALCVLAVCGDALVDHISDVLKAIDGHDELVDQFLAFFWYAVPVKRWPALADAVRQGPISTPVRDLLTKYLCAFDEIAAADTVTSEEDARRILTSALAQTVYHGDAYMACQALNTWLLSPDESDRALTNGNDVQEMVRNAVAATRVVILPATRALAFWTRAYGHHGRAESELHQAWVRGIYALNDLSVHADALPSGPIGRAAADEIGQLWIAVRRCTQFGGPHNYLVRNIEARRDEIGILERWMPECFSLPWEVAAQAASVLGIRVTISGGDDPVVVVVPVPCAEMRRIFNLLFADMQRHGTGKKDVITFRRISSGTQLETLLENERREDDARGSGMSQRMITKIARKYNIDVTFPQSYESGPYTVRLVFNGVFNLDRD